MSENDQQLEHVQVEEPSGLQIQDGKEVILSKKKERKPRQKKAEILEGAEKKKRVHVWTDSKKAAFEKCRAARLKNIAERKQKEKPLE